MYTRASYIDDTPIASASTNSEISPAASEISPAADNFDDDHTEDSQEHSEMFDGGNF